MISYTRVLTTSPDKSAQSVSSLRDRMLGALVTLAVAIGGLGLGASAHAQEAQIRKNLAERLPQMPKIDEVTKTQISGLYEVRIGTEILYSDESGSFVVQGNIIDTRSRENLTAARIEKLSAIDFAALPLKDAVVWKQGTGARKLVIFADPNCGYCKGFEKTLSNIKDVTVYTFLFPILGGDSPEKSRDIWCSKDAGTAWRKWMLDGTVPARSTGACETPLERNVAMGRKFRVTGTPSIVFEDGSRAPGAISGEQLEKKLESVRAKS